MPRNSITGVATAGLLLLLMGCGRDAVDPASFGSAAQVLRPLPEGQLPPGERRALYIPVYSSIYWGMENGMVELAATLSVRNISEKHALILHSVDYYDSHGTRIREYLKAPAELPPVATVEYVIQRKDRVGGPGANFIVRWSGDEGIDPPLIEAVMVGQSGNMGLSFTSRGVEIQDHR